MATAADMRLTATSSLARRRLRVAELAAAVGVGSDTIRYYEKIGLLLPPERTPAGYRIYDPAVVDRLQFIQGAQRLGLTLLDIKNLLAIRDTGECPCEPAETLLRRRLADLDAELARLTALRDQMVAMVDALPAGNCPPPSPVRWCPPEEGR
jgi:DNA-binding transcriptional MerR regulator